MSFWSPFSLKEQWIVTNRVILLLLGFGGRLRGGRGLNLFQDQHTRLHLDHVIASRKGVKRVLLDFLGEEEHPAIGMQVVGGAFGIGMCESHCYSFSLNVLKAKDIFSKRQQ